MSQTYHAGGHRSGPPVIMGVLNATPDSFSDGGLWTGAAAVRYGIDMADAGASIIDIGGESTRPGALPVSAEEELSRLVPVLRDLVPSLSIPVSVDTMKPEVAERCISMGASIVNDVNALRAPGMMELCAQTGVAAVIMHAEGGIFDKAPGMRGDAVESVSRFLAERAEAALAAGIRRDGIILDPGLGFGKTPEQNMELLIASDRLSGGFPVLIGPSRKRFLAHGFPGMPKDEATAVACRIAADAGADYLRVHDVGRVAGIGRDSRWRGWRRPSLWRCRRTCNPSSWRQPPPAHPCACTRRCSIPRRTVSGRRSTGSGSAQGALFLRPCSGIASINHKMITHL